jgi:adenylate cyclase
MLINSLLTPLSEAVVSNKGTIDKYMGDNIMAFWNAPLPDDDHAQHACLAALEMSSRLNKLNEERRANNEIPLEIGVGINTGECVVGNMGSNLRFDYTVLGDAVNLASRLEGQTKSYGVQIIIGEGTASAVAGKIAILRLDRVRVKGKKEPEEIYAVVGNEEVARSAHFLELADNHALLLDAYFGQDWKAVRKLTAKCMKLAQPYEIPELYEVYATRAKKYAEAPPGKNWSGVNDTWQFQAS